MTHSKVEATSATAKTTNLFLEYCSNSSVHGVRYLGSTERSQRCDKFWWLVVFVLSVGSCSLLIHKTYQKWEENPVIVSFSERLTPVSQIPFPAVTICPQSKTKVSKYNFTRDFEDVIAAANKFNFTRYFWEHLTKERPDYNKTDYLLAKTQLCGRDFYRKYGWIIDYLPNKTSNASYSSTLKEISLSMSKISCTIHGEDAYCGYLFSPTLTDEGFCITFNILRANELLRLEHIQSKDSYIHAYLWNKKRPSQWSLEDGYYPNVSLQTYPHRTLGQGYSAGVSLILLSNDDDQDYFCGGEVQGYKVHLHSPADYPHVSKKFTYIPADQEVTVAVKPQMVTTTSGLRAYSPDRRLCYFNDERYLKFFQVYTQDNCELECLTNYTLHLCGCVKFSMLRANDTSVCETNQLACMLRAETQLLNMNTVQNPDAKEKNFRAECNCLPACTSIQYDAEITQTSFHYKKKYLSDRPKELYDVTQVARITVYFKEAQFMSSKRSELYGLTDFLANCGGLLGLCMGVSLLSLVELLYFCTVRPFSLWRKQEESLPSGVSKAVGYDETSGITQDCGSREGRVEAILSERPEEKY